MPQYRVPGIHCDGCIRALTSAVQDIDSRATLQADLTSKRVRVESTSSEAAIVEAIRDAGFDIEPI